MIDQREDELKKAVEDLKKEVPEWLMGKSMSWGSWIMARLDLLKYQVEKLQQLRQADISIRRKLEERIAKLEEK